MILMTDLANKIKVSPQTIRRWIKSGTIKATKKRIRGVTTWTFEEMEVNRYLNTIQ